MKGELLTQKARSEPANVIPLEIVEAVELAQVIEEKHLPAAYSITGMQVLQATGSAVVWIAGAALTGTKAALVLSGYVVGGVLLILVELLQIVLEAVRSGLDKHGYHGRPDVQQDAGQHRTGNITIINEVRTSASANVRIENRIS